MLANEKLKQNYVEKKIKITVLSQIFSTTIVAIVGVFSFFLITRIYNDCLFFSDDVMITAVFY